MRFAMGIASAALVAAAAQAFAQGIADDACRPRSGRGSAAAARELYAGATAAASVDRRIELLRRSLDEHPAYETSYALGAAFEKAGRDRDARSCFMWAYGLTDEPKAKAQAAARVAMTYPLESCAADRINWLKQSVNAQRFPAVERELKIAAAHMDAAVNAASIQKALTPCDPASSDTARDFDVEPSIDVRIPFDFDRSTLTAEGMRQVRELGRALESTAFARNAFLLIGHTDARGTDDYNDKLSRGRAETVRDLLAREFPRLAGRIDVQGLGRREPLITAATEQDHALNRRVEVVVKER